MSSEELIGIIIGCIAVGVLTALVVKQGISLRLKNILLIALACRIAGIFGRQMIAADAMGYYYWGCRYADYFTQLDFSPLWDQDLMRHPSWIGTNFVGYVAGIVISIVGESWTGGFIGFTLIALVGLLLFAFGFRNKYRECSLDAFWSWLLLVPSLWFWPSSIGKEAIMLLGLGTATYGFIGRRDNTNWPVLGLGTVIVFCIRPEVAAVLIFSVVCSYWLNFDKWKASDLISALIVLSIGLAFIGYAMSFSIGGGINAESLEGYVKYGQQQSGQGGSEIGKLDTNATSIPLAFVNVLFRPFIWEAHNLGSAFAAGEVLLLWGLILIRRRALSAAIRMWRFDRVLRFAIPFFCVYVLAFGLTIANLGIVARQRVLVFPFLFLVIEVGAYYLKKHSTNQPRTKRHVRKSHNPLPRRHPTIVR